MMMDVELITQAVKLNSKLQQQSLVYMIPVMHIYLQKELKQLLEQEQMHQQDSQMKKNKEIILKNCCTIFMDYVSIINNMQIDNAKYLDVVMPIYNLTEIIKI